jgi:DNA-binding response OmpR family regulator
MSSDGANILVVEDDDVERDSLVELLRLWGYEARGASDGCQALKAITSSTFDLVLSDAHMPHMSGLGLLRELRRNLHLVSCVIISGQEDEIEESEARRLGARGFLKKPIHPEELKAEMKQCLDARRGNELTQPAFQSELAPRGSMSVAPQGRNWRDARKRRN